MSEPNAPAENPRSPRPKARYIMIGGFLGAGKTTSVARLARRLTDRGLRVGLITNDQGNELVDTAMLRSHGFATEEIPGGCFCCRFNSLVDAADRLSASARPDVFIAEPVGSCTDLVATVTYPLRRMYGDSFSIAPLSVLVDPIRALRIFGLEPGGKFSEKVLYIYRKQLEEADLIVINKCDLVSEARLAALRQALIANFPEAELIQILYERINQLPERMQQVFKLTYLEGYSRTEIAQMLNLSENTVRNTNAAAMKALRLTLSVEQFMVLISLANLFRMAH